MKSKRLILAALAGTLLCSGTWAIGLGAQFNMNVSADADFVPGWAIAVSPKENVHLSFFWDFAKEENSILGLTADLWLLNPDLLQFGSAGALGIFVGPGLYGSFSTADNGVFNFGLRVPIGVNLHLLDRLLEIYLQAAPSWGLILFPSPGLGGLTFPISLGFRFWIR